MSDDNDPEAPSSRWTCEACGCHTNTEANNSASCGICGTRRGKLDIDFSLQSYNFLNTSGWGANCTIPMSRVIEIY